MVAVLEFLKWVSINALVSIGIAFLAESPQIAGGRPSREKYRAWWSAAATSVMVLFCLVYPWEVRPGQLMDIRVVPMMLQGWRYGWKSAVPVWLLMSAYRIYLGGPGVPAGIVYPAVSLVLVALFEKRPRNLPNLAALGFLSTLAGMTSGTLLTHPRPEILEPTNPFWLLILAVHVVSLWLLNAAGEQVWESVGLRRKLQAELSVKEAVLEMIPYGIIFLDRERLVTGNNQAARAHLLHGQVPHEILDHSAVASALREHRRISNCQITYRSGAAEHIVYVSAVPLSGGGAVLGVENVTGLIHEARAEARRERLELLGRLAAMAAHEIRNPLTTIKGFLQLLGPRPEFEGHRNTFQLVQGEVEQINRVVTDFLDLAAPTGGSPGPVPIDSLLRDVVGVMGLQFPGNQVRVRYEGEADLLGWANPKSLKQILKNLVTNAYEAMPGGGELTIRRERQGESVCLRITDTGPGIPPEILPMIFTPYMTTKTTGTGLGLAIAHKLASEMGGRLGVSSAHGSGCSFQLTFPAASGNALNEAAAGEQTDSRAPGH